MSPATTPSERSAIAKIAALTRHAHTDGREATAAARHASHVTRFEDQVDPDRVLAPAERQRRVQRARRAHFNELARRSANARRARTAQGSQGTQRPETAA
jgi:hypothetical protein